jgi:hypothetical protein
MALSSELKRELLASRARSRLERVRELKQEPRSGPSISLGESPSNTDQAPDTTPANILHAVANQSNGSSAEIELPAVVNQSTSSVTETEPPADTLTSGQEEKPAAWWPRFIGPSTREVLWEDALDCVRLVLAELWGEERAWKAQIQVEGQTVRLSQLYAELERLTGDPACWGTVQTLMLRARKREGIQPLTGVPLPTRSTYRAAVFPWLQEDNGLRRGLQRDGCWSG